MTDDDLIHVIWTVWPLIDRFEADPYGLSRPELGVLNQYEQRKRYSKYKAVKANG